MNGLTTVIFLFTSLLLSAEANGFYTILAPNALRSNSEYKVVFNWDMPDVNTLSVVVMGIDGSGQTKYSESQDVHLEPHSTKNVYFHVSFAFLKFEVGYMVRIFYSNSSLTIWRN
jgi:hypothetical protein